MKTTSYELQCKFGSTWSIARTFTSKRKAKSAIAWEKIYDKSKGWKYDYRLVRVTTTREVVK